MLFALLMVIIIIFLLFIYCCLKISCSISRKEEYMSKIESRDDYDIINRR